MEATTEHEAMQVLQMTAYSYADAKPLVDMVIFDIECDAIDDPFFFFKTIRGRYFPNELPIVFVTSKTKQEETRLLLANSFIMKPVDRADLRGAAKNFIYIKRLNDIQTNFIPREFLDLLNCATITDIRLGALLFCR